MKIIPVTDKNVMSRRAAEMISTLVREKPDAVLGLATGGTPEETYRRLADDYRNNHTTYQKIRTVNLDEYVGLSKEDPNSYHKYMENHFYKFVDIPADQHFLPDGNAVSLDQECGDYDRMIERLGGVDLQLLGIGRNGHIGFNEPGTSLNIGTHVVTLTDSTRLANARFFGSMDAVPVQAVTMGIGTIMKSKSILLLVSGKSKAEAMNRLLESKTPDPDFPASVLVSHPDVTVIADAEALFLTNKKVGKF
ncbi:glucosamine-6-phosphate deaminase [Sporolactobacillus shoreae]|uniref:Glucosamine-6-phosphate deaminase n=1 Tax=Sporolactobacillus shoreae TaxID=1465501 RepID=A0A4Z0GST6_9BACL|nr:glucosamine-6-phosphate deaminase [Sporolactobacillus shoreae]TGA99754.1 glucosamine-6-phosphate deaminase [Sporolactobacillus shoreae]